MSNSGSYDQIKEKIVKEIDAIIEKKEALVRSKQERISEKEEKIEIFEKGVKSGKNARKNLDLQIVEFSRQEADFDLQIGNLHAQIKIIENEKRGLQAVKLEREQELQKTDKMNLETVLILEKYKNDKALLQKDLEELITINDASIKALTIKKPEDEDDNTCPICLEGYNKTDHFRSCISLCFHQFGMSCLEKFLMHAVRLATETSKKGVIYIDFTDLSPIK
ncbi:unnamed protein product [Oikopleura dioica]|uniref:RING-type domain-containing protein n=1 Tax=Oikopleura dioica TaxID=34765 RepID=E4XQG4_OIKDI|nr:unnamed protein product [Oikopleura dioica]